jgi:hypothetical protein
MLSNDLSISWYEEMAIVDDRTNCLALKKSYHNRHKNLEDVYELFFSGYF